MNKELKTMLRYAEFAAGIPSIFNSEESSFQPESILTKEEKIKRKKKNKQQRKSRKKNRKK